MRLRVLLRVCALTLAPAGVWGQELPFTVPTIGWAQKPLTTMRKEYANARESELLYCVVSWTTQPPANGVQMILITSVRRAYAGSKHALADVDEHCRAEDGSMLPMVHTHSDGNCQFSPRDLITAAARRAAFEGIQCGPRHFIWTTSAQIVLLADAVANRRQDSLLAAGSRSRP